MANVVDRTTGVPHRLVFELRYEGGELYWDRCGRIARTLAHREGWATQVIDTNGCHIRNDDDNLVFSFSPDQPLVKPVSESRMSKRCGPRNDSRPLPRSFRRL